MSELQVTGNYGVSAKKERELLTRMARLEVYEDDLEERFIRGSGSGGQKINKTSSCVHLKHIPTGFEVKCQKERSRALNRFYARRDLCDKIEEKVLGEKSAKRQKAEKVRRQKRKRSKRAKEKMLKNKKVTSKKKELRKPPKSD